MQYETFALSLGRPGRAGRIPTELIYRAPDGTLPTIAAALTDVEPPDAFRRVAAGRAAFRTVDLLTLRDVLRRLANRMDDGDA